MSYVINKTNGSQITVVADGTIDNTLDIKLIGMYYGGYGEVQNENFVFMLENFANNTQPAKPLTGQLWYDTATKKMKYYDSTTFRGLGSIDVAATSPLNPILGDFWYNTTTKQLKVFNGAQFSLIGPQAAGTTITEMRSLEVVDTLSHTHSIIEAIVDDGIVFIISNDPVFTLNNSINEITGFSKIYQGITVSDITETDGVIRSDPNGYKYNGTSTDSDHFNGLSTSDFILNIDPIELTYLTEFSSSGFTVGTSNNLKVFMDGSTPVIENQVGNNLEFRTTVSGNTVTKLQILGANTLPGVDYTSDIGSSTLKFKKFYVYDIDSESIKVKNNLIAGSLDEIKLFVDNSNGVLANQLTNTLELRTTIATSTTTKLKIINNDTVPGVDNASDLGSSALKFKKVYAYEVETGLINGLIPFSFPAGTKLLFAQASAPTGWTQVTSSIADDRMLRVVKYTSSDTESLRGGYFDPLKTHSPILMNVVPSHTHVFVGSLSASNSHAHGGVVGGGAHEHYNVAIATASVVIDGGTVPVPAVGRTLTGGDHVHGIPSEQVYTIPVGTNNNNVGATNWEPKYLNLILCSKD